MAKQIDLLDMNFRMIYMESKLCYAAISVKIRLSAMRRQPLTSQFLTLALFDLQMHTFRRLANFKPFM